MTRDELIESVRAAAAADDRVVALFLTGSLGSGQGDRFADCDFVAAVRPEAHAAFVEDVRGWVGRIVEPVLWRQVHPGIPLFHAVTAEWLRLDVTVTIPDRLTGSRSAWRPLHDPRDLYGTLPPRPPARNPDPAKVRAIAEEFLRIVGLLPLGVGRGEFVVGAMGVGLLRDQLVALLIEGHAPPVRPGALRLKGVLDPEEIALLEALPPVRAERQSVIEGSLACAAAFLPRARRLLTRLGGEWPEALETAARDHIARELGLDLPSSRP